jgi:dTDP-4-dehydrorhamnose reductase
LWCLYAVDKAESENELADIVNHKAVKLIAQYADNHVKLIHISTDYVLMERHLLH